jgi:hypothetical protein
VQAAIEAVKQWRYNPYLLNGEPVEVDSRITDSFGSCGRHEKMGCNLTLRPELESSTVILGPSPTKPVSEEARTAGLAWERLPDPKPQLMLEIVFPSGQEHIFYLGPHAPASRLKKSTYCTASGWN